MLYGIGKTLTDDCLRQSKERTNFVKGDCSYSRRTLHSKHPGEHQIGMNIAKYCIVLYAIQEL